jgi:hypothetical protein
LFFSSLVPFFNMEIFDLMIMGLKHIIGIHVVKI